MDPISAQVLRFASDGANDLGFPRESVEHENTRFDLSTDGGRRGAL